MAQRTTAPAIRIGRAVVAWSLAALALAAPPARAERPEALAPREEPTPRDRARTSTPSAEAPLSSDYDVVVLAGPHGPSPLAKDPSISGSVITGERLRGAGLEAADVLRTQPGVQVTESGGFGAPSTASIRGATAADTPIYLGGVRLNDDVGGTADLSLVPLWILERVEIYRGHAPLEADRLGPGGAIFFEPRRPGEATLGAGLLGGSFDTFRGYGFAGGRLGRVSALVGGSADLAQNDYAFTDDRGTLFDTRDDVPARRTNADLRGFDGWGLATIDLGEGRAIDVLAHGARRAQGVPRLAILPTLEARSDSARLLGSIALRWPFGDGGAHIFESRSSALWTRAAYDDPLLELTLHAREVDVSAERLEQSASAAFALGEHLRLRPALVLAHERLERTPGDVPLDGARRLFARVAAAAEVTLSEGITLRGLVSGECHATTRGGRACDLLLPSGRAGLEVGSTRLRILVSAGRYARVPTLGELYGVSGPVRGNAQLAPESGLTVEAGVRGQSARWGALDGAFADLFLFARAAEALIAYRRVGQGYVVPYNVGRARVLGAELALGASLFSRLRAEVAATLLDPRDTSPGRTTANDLIAYRSRLVVAPRLSYSAPFAPGRVLARLGADATYTHQASRYADPAGLAVLPANGTLDLGLESTWLEGHLAAKVRASQVLGGRRTDVVGYPLPERSIFFALETEW